VNDGTDRAAVERLLKLLARHLEDYLQGDELAFESLRSLLDDGVFTEDQVQSAALVLRGLTSADRVSAGSTVDAPRPDSQRVLSDQERGSLSPEAWGYLLDLKRLGSLDAGQFERVLDRLSTSGIRPVGVEMAHQVAMRVALARGGQDLEDVLGENDSAH
jgi:uncharacterized protein Smg (DUF494 family)